MGLRARIWPGVRTRGIWLELVLAVVTCFAGGVGATTPERGRSPELLLLLASVGLGVLVLLLRRRAPLVPFLASAALAALSPAVNAGMLFTSYAVARHESRWPVRGAAAVVGTLAISRFWVGGQLDDQLGRWASSALLLFLPGAVGVIVRVRAQLVIALRERAERAEAERELLARDAVLTERTRIAREMHDAVGHRVSLMVLQAGAIEMAAADADRVAQLAGQVQTAGRQALDELRQMVGVLRAGDDDAPLTPQPSLPDLPTLVHQAREAGMTVDLEAPDLPDVDPVAGRAAYRIAQEALTNAAKHAPGSSVRVCVQRQDDGLHVRVVNGPASVPVVDTPGGGYGLVGLGERVRTLGGRLHAGPRLDGGFEIEAVLPA